MRKKTCIGCKKSKPESEFRWKIKAKNIRIPRCEDCDREYRARYYRENLVKFRESDKRARNARKAKVEKEGLKEKSRKKCSGCGKTKALSSFRWFNKAEGRRISRCRDCDQANRKKDYEKNREKYLARNRTLYAKLRSIALEHKNKPCKDCKKKYPYYVMDYDHVDPKTKVAKVSSLIHRGSEKLLLDEIAKCDVVCSNCHRIRSHQHRKGDQNGSRELRTCRENR